VAVHDPTRSLRIRAWCVRTFHGARYAPLPARDHAQKSLRSGGKPTIWKTSATTARHHNFFFEMLGNFHDSSATTSKREARSGPKRMAVADRAIPAPPRNCGSPCRRRRRGRVDLDPREIGWPASPCPIGRRRRASRIHVPIISGRWADTVRRPRAPKSSITMAPSRPLARRVRTYADGDRFQIEI